WNVAQLQQQGIAGCHDRGRRAPDQPLRRHRTEPSEAWSGKARCSEDFCRLAGFGRGTTGDRRLPDGRTAIVQSIGPVAEVMKAAAPCSGLWKATTVHRTSSGV